MKIYTPEITIQRISDCIREQAERLDAPTSFGSDALPMAPASGASEFSFSAVDSELHRAKSKTLVKGVKLFRRVRRNQAAVNESLVAAVGELTAVNRQMAQEIERLRVMSGNLLTLVRRYQSDIVALQRQSEELRKGCYSFEEKVSNTESQPGCGVD